MEDRTEKIREFIIENVSKNPKEIGMIAASHFKVTRSAISRHLNALIEQGIIEAQGRTRAREYHLKNSTEEFFEVALTPELQEDIVWVKQVEPYLHDLPQNVKQICEYGFTEMLNNAMDHSGSKTAKVAITRNAVSVEIIVRDYGVGIFNKIQSDFPYIVDDRHAAFELSKGLLTSDKSTHSGLGIFFTSRMFDYFSIQSGDVTLISPQGGESWIFEKVSKKPTKGTAVWMEIHPKAPQTKEKIFSEYETRSSPLRFLKTHVPLNLMRYEGQELVSRSQAKRLLSRVNQFDEVLLDFKGVSTIGHSFADEIFRVYQRNHPDVEIIAINTNPEIDRAIQAAKAASEAG